MRRPAAIGVCVVLAIALAMGALRPQAARGLDNCNRGNLCHKCDIPVCIPNGPPFGYNRTVWNRWPIQVTEEEFIVGPAVPTEAVAAPPQSPASPAPDAAPPATAPIAPTPMPIPPTPPSPSDELAPPSADEPAADAPPPVEETDAVPEPGVREDEEAAPVAPPQAATTPQVNVAPQVNASPQPYRTTRPARLTEPVVRPAAAREVYAEPRFAPSEIQATRPVSPPALRTTPQSMAVKSDSHGRMAAQRPVVEAVAVETAPPVTLSNWAKPLKQRMVIFTRSTGTNGKKWWPLPNSLANRETPKLVRLIPNRAPESRQEARAPEFTASRVVAHRAARPVVQPVIVLHDLR